MQKNKRRADEKQAYGKRRMPVCIRKIGAEHRGQRKEQRTAEQRPFERPIFHPRVPPDLFLSARRPVEIPAGKHVKMQVTHRLSTILAGVGHDTEPLFRKA